MEILHVITALATLCKYCYWGDIYVDEHDWYIGKVQSAVNNLLIKINALPEQYRKEFSGKFKLHLLVHLVDCIKRFGSLKFECTEKEESYNQSPRSVIANSNRHAYSLHSVRRFAQFQSIQSLLAGSSIAKECGSHQGNLF